jgi:hypothetical protein
LPHTALFLRTVYSDLVFVTDGYSSEAPWSRCHGRHGSSHLRKSCGSSFGGARAGEQLAIYFLFVRRSQIILNFLQGVLVLKMTSGSKQ